MEKTESKFLLKGIVLVESFFKRIPEVVINQGELTETNIEVKSQAKEDKKIATELIVIINSKYNEKVQFEGRFVMVGMFEAQDASKEEIDNFKRINAPAIIYPFLREHIVSISMKAAMPPIILPIMNFVQKAKDSEETEKVDTEKV